MQMEHEKHSSPHERMLAYLREGERLIEDSPHGAPGWDVVYRALSEAADQAEAGVSGDESATRNETGLHTGSIVW